MTRRANLAATLARPVLSWQELTTALARLRGSGPPELSIAIPVNARGDQEKVRNLLSDLAEYRGKLRIEVVLVVNNYLPEDPPEQLAAIAALPARLVAVPDLRRRGEAVGFTARMIGIRAATADAVVSFDADCRIADPSALLDWYAAAFGAGAQVAYTPVRYYELRDRISVYARIAIHHASRWAKRALLRIPTARGSNYGVRRSVVLPLYDVGMLADEMNVAPTVKAEGGQIAYSGRRALAVYTSGRMFGGGWRKLWRYLLYRLRYNFRVIPVGADAARRTGRENDPVRVYVDNRPVVHKS